MYTSLLNGLSNMPRSTVKHGLTNTRVIVNFYIFKPEVPVIYIW